MRVVLCPAAAESLAEKRRGLRARLCAASPCDFCPRLLQGRRTVPSLGLSGAQRRKSLSNAELCALNWLGFLNSFLEKVLFHKKALSCNSVFVM